MTSSQNKGNLVLIILVTPLLLLAIYHWYKIMTSAYNTDLGNGVVIYADDYVKTGRWVFDCNRSRLISREPLAVPIDDFEKSTKITTGKMYTLSKPSIEKAEEFIKSITTTPEWYRNLHYRYSVLGENSDLSSHLFGLISSYEGKQWTFKVWQEVGHDGNSSFEITAEPYDPETYVDYSKALQSAAKSCPKSQ